MEIALEQLINGLTVGSVYALVALGYTMVYGVLLLINFAHGEFFMMGAYVGIVVVAALAVNHGAFGIVALGILVLAFIVGGITLSIVGVSVERLAYRPLRRVSRLAPLISALGMSIFLRGAAGVVTGRKPSPMPTLVPSVTWHFFGASVTNLQVVVFLVAVGLMFALQWLVTRTVFGMTIRAVAEDYDAASLVGVDINRVISAVFVIGPALGAAGGILYSTYYGVAIYNMGYTVGIKAFTAAVLGGIGNIRGAMIGGMLLGLVETFGIAVLPNLTHGAVTAEYKDIFAFLVLVGVLIFRPEGILGEQVASR